MHHIRGSLSAVNCTDRRGGATLCCTKECPVLPQSYLTTLWCMWDRGCWGIASWRWSLREGSSRLSSNFVPNFSVVWQKCLSSKSHHYPHLFLGVVFVALRDVVCSRSGKVD